MFGGSVRVRGLWGRSCWYRHCGDDVVVVVVGFVVVVVVVERMIVMGVVWMCYLWP